MSFSNIGVDISGLASKSGFFKTFGSISSNYSPSSISISSSSSALTSASKKSTLSISILKSNIAHTSSLHLNPKIYKNSYINTDSVVLGFYWSCNFLFEAWN